MADFLTTYNQYIQPNEGYFANLTGDSGGETYGGIARNLNPQWEGWPIVDQYVYYKGGLSAMENNEQIPDADPYVVNFYQNLWSNTKMGSIVNQGVANILFDFIVNSGINTAVKHVQKIVGVTADGIIGNQTLAAINAFNPSLLFDAIKEDRASFYTKLANTYANDKQFLSGWLNRLTKFTSENPAATGIGLGVFALVVVGFTLLSLKNS